MKQRVLLLQALLQHDSLHVAGMGDGFLFMAPKNPWFG